MAGGASKGQRRADRIAWAVYLASHTLPPHDDSVNHPYELLLVVRFDVDQDVSRLETLLQQLLYRIGDLMSFRGGKSRVDEDNHVDRRAAAHPARSYPADPPDSCNTLDDAENPLRPYREMIDQRGKRASKESIREIHHKCSYAQCTSRIEPGKPPRRHLPATNDNNCGQHIGKGVICVCQ